MRVLLGLLAQPVVAGAAAFMLFPALDYTASAAGIYHGRLPDPVGAAISIALGAALAAVFVVVFGALPAIGWVSQRRPLTLTSSVVAGALLGNLPLVVILLLVAVNGGGRLPTGASDALALLPSIAFGSCVGVACGVVFWRIAGAPRPTVRVETPE